MSLLDNVKRTMLQRKKSNFLTRSKSMLKRKRMLLNKKKAAPSASSKKTKLQNIVIPEVRTLAKKVIHPSAPVFTPGPVEVIQTVAPTSKKEKLHKMVVVPSIVPSSSSIPASLESQKPVKMGIGGMKVNQVLAIGAAVGAAIWLLRRK